MLYSVEYKDKKGKNDCFVSTDLFMINRMVELINYYDLEITDFKSVNL